MVPLSKIEQFMRLLHAVQNVTRASRVPDEQSFRNTAEHTFEVVMLAWYVASVNKLKLDHEKILKYALAHDLVEGYAGDTPIHDTNAQKFKKEKETAALKRISAEFPEFSELHTTIHAYEQQKDAESKFVYAIDKLVDPLNASMEKTQSIWKDLGMTYEHTRAYKDPKIAQDSHVERYWKQLITKLEKNKEFFFPPH